MRDSFISDAERDAVNWAQANGKRTWRRRYSEPPEILPVGYRGFHYFPFGIGAWNWRVHLIRLYLKRTAGLDYNPPPDVLDRLQSDMNTHWQWNWRAAFGPEEVTA